MNPPEQSTQSLFQLSAVNNMSMQRAMLPPVRIQRRCPWMFPANSGQRQEAVSGGLNGPYSLFYPCGYSADQSGGIGSLTGGAAYTSCGYTRTDCEARGMFSGPMRFGGLEFVPASIQVRGYGSGWQYAPVDDNVAIYNDFVPMLYGIACNRPPIVFSRNDGNLTHMEVLLGMGAMQDVQKVLVNQIEIPVGQSGQNMTATGWYNAVSMGGRDGAFNPDFVNAAGSAAGDLLRQPGVSCRGGSESDLQRSIAAYGASSGRGPAVTGLWSGWKLSGNGVHSQSGMGDSGHSAAERLGLIERRSGLVCRGGGLLRSIQTEDLSGNSIPIARFQCNLCLQTRRNAADTIRGIRNAARLLFTYSIGGLLQLQVENALALQQPAQTAWTNSTETLNGGWPAYEFSDDRRGRRIFYAKLMANRPCRFHPGISRTLQIR